MRHYKSNDSIPQESNQRFVTKTHIGTLTKVLSNCKLGYVVHPYYWELLQPPVRG